MERVIETHCNEYGVNPDVVVSAPGRFHLIGEHSWFCRDKTLSMAVDLPVYVAVSVRNDTSVRCYFKQLDERKRVNLLTLKYKKEDRWANAVKSVLYGIMAHGLDCRGMNITICSEILPSAGFGITTAVKLAVLYCCRELFFPSCPDCTLHTCLAAGNRHFLNMNTYSADVFTAMYAQQRHCVLTNYETQTYDLFPFNFEGYSVLLTDARVPRVLVWDEGSLHAAENILLLGELKVRKPNIYGGWIYQETGTDIIEVLAVVDEFMRKRMMSVIKEHKNVLDAVDGLVNTNFEKFARAVNKSHDNMRDLFNVSCPEIDWLTKRVQEFDMVSSLTPKACARITGKGFGRCSYTILKTADVEKYRAKLSEYERIFGFRPVCYEVMPSSGIKVLI